MSYHSVVQAKNNLSDLLARAQNGEEIVITRHGVPIIALQPVRPALRPMTEADFVALRARRLRAIPGAPDSATLVRQMRDQGF